jgi:dethiobiotin synthetase
MAARGCFITGTDTGVGKTRICAALIEVLKQRGLRVAAMKPVASGSVRTAHGFRNSDAELLLKHANTTIDYRTLNPYTLERPAAPFIAAKSQGVSIEAGVIMDSYRKLLMDADAILVEGVGGWQIRLNDNLWMPDLIKRMRLPVIMVVGMRLGCINHAHLTADAIINNGCALHGWVANHIDRDYQDGAETLDLLSESIPAPRLAVVPFIGHADTEQTASYMRDIDVPILKLDEL